MRKDNDWNKGFELDVSNTPEKNWPALSDTSTWKQRAH